MDFKGEIAGRFLRIIAVVALLVGLGDAARLLGVTSGSVSPLQLLGPAGFIYLSVFCLARLFAAVGIWIGASWGTVLLVGATVVASGRFLIGIPDVRSELICFGILMRMPGGIVVVCLRGLSVRRAHD